MIDWSEYRATSEGLVVLDTFIPALVAVPEGQDPPIAKMALARSGRFVYLFEVYRSNMKQPDYIEVTACCYGLVGKITNWLFGYLYVEGFLSLDEFLCWAKRKQWSPISYDLIIAPLVNRGG